MVKRPAYQWYPADADSDEVFKLMTYEQEGIYRRLLDHQWIEGSIPADPNLIAALLPKIPKDRFLEAWPLISGKFRPRNVDRLVNDRLESQRRELDKFIRLQKARSRKGVEARKLRAQSGQPMGQPLGHPKPHQRSTSSSSTSTSSKNSTHPTGEAPTERAPSPAKEFLAWFQSEYKARRNGAAYFVRWDKHMSIVGRLLKLHDPQRLRKHAQILLTTDEDWTATTDRGIEILASKINWLDERLCAWEAKRKAREAV